MARTQEESGFFNAKQSGGSYDRTYDASDFAGYFANFIGNGVFINPINQLQVVAKSGLTVTVKKGNAFIEGYWYKLKEDISITMSANTTSSITKNVICCELNKTNREITIIKKQNVSSLNPVNNGTVHELVLANIEMPASVSTISNSMIKDLRPEKRYCGFVESVVEQVDFDNLFLQLETQFNEWFNRIKGQLSTDQAGKLQNQIDNTNTKVNKLEQEVPNKQNKVSIISGGLSPNNECFMLDRKKIKVCNFKFSGSELNSTGAIGLPPFTSRKILFYKASMINKSSSSNTAYSLPYRKYDIEYVGRGEVKIYNPDNINWNGYELNLLIFYIE